MSEITLLTADGDFVARLEISDPQNRIEYNGRTFERGWTNEGNTDADERLWFEVEP